MGIAAKQMFNTRGDLRFYTFQMTLEIIFFTIVVIDVASSTTTSRFVCVVFFVIAVTNDFSHILIQIRRHGVFFKCTESDVMLQHCLFKAIPTHHHGLYVSAILFALHLAIILANVSAVIFYDKSLDYYMEITPGKPQFVTNLPEQEESSVRYTIIGRDGKEITKPHDVTITRKFTLKAPGMSGVTAQRSWKKQGTDSQTKLAAGKSAGASKPLTGSSAEKGPSITNTAKTQEKPKETLFECPCGGPAQEPRGAAGKDPATAKSYSNALYERAHQLTLVCTRRVGGSSCTRIAIAAAAPSYSDGFIMGSEEEKESRIIQLVKVAVRQDLTRAPEDIRPEREEILAAVRAEDVLAKKAQEDPSRIDLTGAL
ncbi:unnamed protein product [Nippostrongylus brasiliensis]|uniref:Uncharacterized protein n=1 Tax=Nippostrongylus brasiliensis TaxID=27835 RepID=A0A158R220_NIPBR|nr:unnamed protein product [Nippostrongylus brasiliensis]